MESNYNKTIISPLLLIIGFTVISNIVIVAIPAFYNNDELNKLDLLQQLGLVDYIKTFFTLSSLTKGFFFRPVGSLIEALAFSAVPKYLFLVHLFDVLMHSIVSCLLFLVLYRYTKRRHAAVMSAIFFAISPLTTIAVGWSDAIFDRLYSLFILCALYFFLGYLKSDDKFVRVFNAALMFVVSALAILSKETAVVLPVVTMLAILWLRLRHEELDTRAAIAGLITISIPVAAFLLLRTTPLYVSSQAYAGDWYRMSLANIPHNILVYFSFPFFVPLTVVSNHVVFPNWVLLVAAAIHLIVVFIVFKRGGIIPAVFYCVFYFVFLIPVLPIKNLGDQYLYGSGLVLGTAMAFLLSTWGKHVISNIAVCVLFIGLSVHTLFLHSHLYYVGTCQARILTSLEIISKSLSKDEREKGVTIFAEPNSPIWVLGKTVSGTTERILPFVLTDKEPIPGLNKPDLHFDKTCNIFLVHR